MCVNFSPIESTIRSRFKASDKSPTERSRQKRKKELEMKVVHFALDRNESFTSPKIDMCVLAGTRERSAGFRTKNTVLCCLLRYIWNQYTHSEAVKLNLSTLLFAKQSKRAERGAR